ncbi:cupin domain-containing protein [Flagellimonas algicola]|uniref:Cupin 2 conserved barrel domain-containing protein n=1 Tax=Flagellimonas algicola TaxID=2583815 RepID=A0ABY2WGG9_9FLAO|nr:hypothetical protein [Allomuricauda algicola]TMU50626.1 hypothetical protein FGG15_18955 [Allomuricauda algicola]
MYKIDNHIRTERFDGLKVHQLTKTESLEVLLISLEKDAIFPEHSSPKDVHLLVLEGDIDFRINKHNYRLMEQQYFNFPKDEIHWVKAHKNSKFLIIR